MGVTNLRVGVDSGEVEVVSGEAIEVGSEAEVEEVVREEAEVVLMEVVEVLTEVVGAVSTGVAGVVLIGAVEEAGVAVSTTESPGEDPMVAAGDGVMYLGNHGVMAKVVEEEEAEVSEVEGVASVIITSPSMHQHRTRKSPLMIDRS